jgi:hypothetical protein
VIEPPAAGVRVIDQFGYPTGGSVTIPTPASTVASAQVLAPAQLVMMTPDELHKAASKCRKIAAILRQQAQAVSVANLAASAANPATALARETTRLCGGHLMTALTNVANYLEKEHAFALDKAAQTQVAQDNGTATGFARAAGTR